MLWVALFIAGVFGILAGGIPLILNGLRAGSATILALGLLLLVSGTIGVVAKPDLVALRLPRLVFGGSPAPAAVEPQVVKSTNSLPAPDEPKMAETPAAPAADVAAKDKSQMAAKMPEPVTVTTTKIVGGEGEPMAGQSAPLNDASAGGRAGGTDTGAAGRAQDRRSGGTGGACASAGSRPVRLHQGRDRRPPGI